MYSYMLFSCKGDIKFTYIPMIHSCTYEKSVFIFYGNLITVQASRTGACGARGGKFWLVKVSSSSEVLLLLQDVLYAQDGGKER